MTPDNDPAPEPTLFSAKLTPHRSLTHAGFVAVMLVVGSLGFVGGIVFLIVGAWPVFGFLGLDVLLVYWAFRANFRAAKAYEQVSVTPSELKIRKVSERGEVAQWTVNPLWVRLEQQTHEEFGLEKLFLVSRGRRLPIASFLGPKEKESFAKALLTGLNEAKRGPTRTVIP